MVKHLQAAKHTLRYMKKGTSNLGIRYTRDLNRLLNRGHNLNVLYGLSDSDFAGCKDTAKSTRLPRVMWYFSMEVTALSLTVLDDSRH